MRRWNLDTHRENDIHFDDLEIKILRNIYGPKCGKGIWKVRSNLELQIAYKSPDILSEIKIRILEYHRNVIRMEEISIQKMVKGKGIVIRVTGRGGTYRVVRSRCLHIF
jgi:hypothetical protein